MKPPCSYESLDKCLFHFKFLTENGHNQWFNENVPYIFQISVFDKLTFRNEKAPCQFKDFCNQPSKQFLETDCYIFTQSVQVTTGRLKGKPPIRPRQSYGAPKIPAYVRGIVGRYQCTNCTTSTQRLNLGFLKLWNLLSIWSKNWCFVQKS